MSVKKNIILSFLISSAIIAVLAAASYVNFVEIRKEIRYLELLDTVRSKSLQLRRHEKNYLLYMEVEEIKGVRAYLKELREIIGEGARVDGSGEFQEMKIIIGKYEGHLDSIEKRAAEFGREFSRLGPSRAGYGFLSPVITSTFLERPMVNARLLQKLFSLPPDAPIIRNLHELADETAALRKDGEEILALSKDLDKSARGRVESAIGILQTATLVLLPLFFVVGLVTLFLISHSVVKRLRILTEAVKKTAAGNFESLAVPEKRDEVGVLIAAFNSMERDLALREEELRKRKNEELRRSRKLASIGTFATGVAHELNNPLNNIYISAQILEKEASGYPPRVKEIMEDIVSQTKRVKNIVGDLLEFARGREPSIRETELGHIIRRAWRQVGITAETGEIDFRLDMAPDSMSVNADAEQMERVFINLFNNAIDAMAGSGNIDVTVRRTGKTVTMTVSDNGRGMPADAVEKIFEPFYTTKDKGTGLGLAIVFNIIKGHGGEIRAESGEGKGTSFIITLPSGENMHES